MPQTGVANGSRSTRRTDRSIFDKLRPHDPIIEPLASWISDTEDNSLGENDVMRFEIWMYDCNGYGANALIRPESLKTMLFENEARWWIDFSDALIAFSFLIVLLILREFSYQL